MEKKLYDDINQDKNTFDKILFKFMIKTLSTRNSRGFP